MITATISLKKLRRSIYPHQSLANLIPWIPESGPYGMRLHSCQGSTIFNRRVRFTAANNDNGSQIIEYDDQFVAGDDQQISHERIVEPLSNRISL
jgi:hypothetical protein